MTKTEEIKRGDRAKVHYRLVGRDGRELGDSSKTGAIEITAGADEVIPGISNALVGMREGDRKALNLAPELAFGAATTAFEREMAREHLPSDAVVGDAIKISYGPTEALVWLVELGETRAKVSTRHPLAGLEILAELYVISRA